MQTLAENIKILEGEFSIIEQYRKEELTNLAKKIKSFKQERDHLDLVFVCTHNSRRSQLAEIWLCTACNYYDINFITTQSAGTEVSSFNERMVNALIRFGFEFKTKNETSNPKYTWLKPKYLDESEKILFSKTIDHPSLKKVNLISVMVCSDADKNCPIIPNCILRYPLRYLDPKQYDGTEKEEYAYDSKVKEIGREMLFLASQINS